MVLLKHLKLCIGNGCNGWCLQARLGCITCTAYCRAYRLGGQYAGNVSSWKIPNLTSIFFKWVETTNYCRYAVLAGSLGGIDFSASLCRTFPMLFYFYMSVSLHVSVYIDFSQDLTGGTQKAQPTETRQIWFRSQTWRALLSRPGVREKIIQLLQPTLLSGMHWYMIEMFLDCNFWKQRTVEGMKITNIEYMHECTCLPLQ